MPDHDDHTGKAVDGAWSRFSGGPEAGQAGDSDAYLQVSGLRRAWSDVESEVGPRDPVVRW